MTRILPLLLSIMLFFTIPAAQAAQTRDRLTVSLPESVLAEALTAALPLEYTADSKGLQGDLRIINISELQLLDQQLGCRLHLAGNNLHIITEMAGQDIRLNVGAVELDFKARAALRFDAAKQVLYLTPIVDKVNSSKDDGGGDIGNAVLQLLNGREFPISLKDIDPIVTQAGAKTLTIATRIADIRSKKEWLQIYFDPQISAN